MKKFIVFLIILTVVFAITACDPNPGTSPDTSKNPGDSPSGSPDPTGQNNDSVLDGSLEDILKEIYEKANLPKDFKDYLNEGVETVPITDENMQYQLGKKGIEFEEAIASEPMIQPSAYSLCLVRVKKGADVEKIKKEIKDNVDPQKWVCVGVDEKNVIVDSIGDVIFLVMSNDHAKALHDAFLSLKG